MSVCKLFKIFVRPVSLRAVILSLDSCDVAIRYFLNHNIDIGSGGVVSTAELAILSVSGCGNIVTDTGLRYH